MTSLFPATLIGRLKIRQRVYAGFGLVIMLAIAIGLSGYLGLASVTHGIDRSDAVNDFAGSASAIDRDILKLRRYVIQYSGTRDEDNLQKARDTQAALDVSLSDVQQKTQDPQRLADLAAMTASFHSYVEGLTRLAAVTQSTNDETAILDGAGPEIANQLDKLRQEGLSVGNTELIAAASQAHDLLMAGRLAVNKMLGRRDPAFAEVGAKQFDALRAALKTLARMPMSQNARSALSEAESGMERYSAGFTEITALIKEDFDLVNVTMARDGNDIGSRVAKILDAAEAELQAIRADLAGTVATAVAMIAGVSLGAIALGCLFAWVIGRGIANPVVSMTAAMQALASGNSDIDVPGLNRVDEIGEMSKAVQVFKENAIEMERLRVEQEEQEKRAAAEKKAAMDQLANDFQSRVGGVIDTVSAAATEMQATATSMSSAAEQTSQQSSSVSAASQQMAGNVQTVASATEELSGSVGEIGRQVTQSNEIAQKAVTQAELTNTSVQGLAEAAKRIGEVVGLISDIAEQTNLLALNATIEAARAGEAGKGFAVVASEVKNLASQTAKATEEVAQQINAVQNAVTDSVGSIDSITHTINEISSIAAAIASAVQEQEAATQEISRNVQEAAKGTEEVTKSISQVDQASTATGAAASQVLSAATELSSQSETLRLEVDRFLSEVRSA